MPKADGFPATTDPWPRRVAFQSEVPQPYDKPQRLSLKGVRPWIQLASHKHTFLRLLQSNEQRHVVRDGDDWAIKKPGADRASSRHDTQREADKRAPRSSNLGGGELH